jgi:flagellar motor switch protein FliN
VQAAAAQTLARDFIRGFFDTIDALLAIGVNAKVAEAAALDADALRDLLGKFPVVMRGTVETGGPVAVLMRPADVARFVAEVMGQEAPSDEVETLDEAALQKAYEVFEPCLGGGCGSLKESTQKELSLKDIALTQEQSDSADQILDALGGSLTFLPFSFSAPSGLKGDGAILIANSLGNLLPDEVLADVTAGPTMSSDEVNDLLDGFDPDSATPGGEAGNARNAPSNLDMVMDIRLVCTARLGRVEMPIADILAFGPGSIIEVGHLVDEPVELLVNDKLIARGDVVVVDEKFGLRITEIVSPAERIKSLG